jgi:uncharacterized membrane protein required for colicin V production
MSLVDFGIVLLVSVFAARGFGRGFVGGVLDLLLLAAAGALAGRYQVPAGRLLARAGVEANVAALAGYFVVLLAVLVLGSFALRLVLGSLRTVPWPPPLPLLDRLFGLLAGGAKGVVAAALVLAALAAAPPQLRLQRMFADSWLAPAVNGVVAEAGQRLSLRPPRTALPVGPEVVPIDLDVLR